MDPIEHGDFPASHVSFQGCNSVPPPKFKMEPENHPFFEKERAFSESSTFDVPC